MKDAYFFHHDANARNDPRILLIRAKHGAAGYGAFFMIVEMLREEESLKLEVNEDLIPMIALGIGAPIEFVQKVVDDCVERKLFTRDTHLYSLSLIRRLAVLAEKRGQKSTAGKAGAKKRWKKAGENSTEIAEGIADGCQDNGNRTEETEETDLTEQEIGPEDLLKLWNENGHKVLPKIKSITPGRKKHARVRISENPSIKYWTEIMEKINKSAFLLGDNNRGWRANFDWLMRPDSGTRILEGMYDRNKSRAAKASAGAAGVKTGKFAHMGGS